MIGALSDMGLSSAAQRFIPEYTELKAFDPPARISLRQRWLAFGIATAHRRRRRARRDAAVAVARPLHRHPALSRLRHHSGLRTGADARPASRSPTTGRIWPGAVLHLAAARAHRADGRRLVCSAPPTDAVTAMIVAVVTALGRHARPAVRARPPAQAARWRRDRSATSRRPGSPPRCRSSWSRASICCSLTSTFSRSSISARPTRSRSITPPRDCWRWSPSSISPSPAPPRTSSREYHVAGDSERLAAFFARDRSAGRSGRRLPPASLHPRLRQAAAVAVRRAASSDGYRRDVHSRRRHAGARRGRPGRTAAQHAGRAQAVRRGLCRRFRHQSRAVRDADPALSASRARRPRPRARWWSNRSFSIAMAKRRLGFHVFILAAQPSRRLGLLAQQPPDHLAGRRHRHLRR